MNNFGGGFEVTVNKDELLNTLRANRDEHVKIYEIALEQYRVEIVDWFNARISDVKAGKFIRHHISLPQPECHVEDYDRVIAMLESHVVDTVTIPEATYRNYVDNEWSWSAAFMTNSTQYAVAGGYQPS